MAAAPSPIILSDLNWARHPGNSYEHAFMYEGKLRVTVYRFADEWRRISKYNARHFYGLFHPHMPMSNRGRMQYFHCPLEFMCAVQRYTLKPKYRNSRR